MTWKEFKEKVESAGVKDDDQIDYVGLEAIDDIQVLKTEEGWQIL